MLDVLEVLEANRKGAMDAKISKLTIGAGLIAMALQAGKGSLAGFADQRHELIIQ